MSDANQFFIEKILEQHDLLDCFSDIYTNPTSVDENGKLRISPYHGGAASTPHSCNLCPPNLCKVYNIGKTCTLSKLGLRVAAYGL